MGGPWRLVVATMSRRDVDRARRARDLPHLDEHVASRTRREPVGFAGLLAWFLEGFWAETPDKTHAAGVWFGRPPRVNAQGDAVEVLGPELVGGSVLGAPRQAEPFRQLLENSPRQTAGDGPDEHYVRPVRAALMSLAYQDGGPFMARFLAQVAYAQGDWESVASRWFPLHEDHAPCVCPEARRPYAEQALQRLWRCYRADPPARRLQRPSWVDKSESQRNAEEVA